VIRGLFIGVDRYQPPVTRLTAAKADAVALSALFEDTLGGEITLLCDTDATLSNIVTELEHLSTAAGDDLVVVSFSGHGTDDHRLVPVDVDVNDLAGTCVSLDELATYLDAIPSKHLLVFLDCCFSGGFGGARVFAPSTQRSMTEDRSSLVALARGSGRVVLTASGAGEPALETAALGHGIFTHHLMTALQGPAGLVAGGRIALLDIVNYVTQHVVEEAARLRAIQTPTVYGSIEGAPTLAALIPGMRYGAAFPDRVRSRASTDWNSLVGFGFPDAVLAKWSQAMPSGLNQLQLDAINRHGSLDGKSLLVVAPTGAGKTMIGELATFRAVANGERSVMLLPLKALVNDKYDSITLLYGDEATVVRATGDHSDQVGAILSGQYDLALLTYEKFLNLALGFPHIMRGISVVVVDEAQIIADPNRGPALEFLLALVRSGYARGLAPQVVALSVIGETNGLETWLGGDLLRTTERPVPLCESVLDAAGGMRTLEPDGSETTSPHRITPEFGSGSQVSKPLIIPLVRKLMSEGKKVIVFRATKGDTVGAAGYLADSLGLPAADDALAQLPEGDRSVASNQLRECVARGVGFHNADLDREERAALEQSFRNPDSALRVLVATTTLAMGINTPAEAVIIAGLTHPGSMPYSIAEYKNMAGRAGRLGQTEAGEAYIIASGDPGPTEAWQRYINGKPEAVQSHFLDQSTDPQTLVLRALVALGSSVDEDELVALLESSFAVWLRQQAGGAGWDRPALQRDLDALIQGGLLDRESNGHLTLTALGRYAGESGIEVRSVTQVASLMRFAPAMLTTADVVVAAQVTSEMDQTFIPANRRSRQEQQRWPFRLQQLGAHSALLQGLHVGGGDPFMRIKRAVAVLLFISASPMAEIEQELLQHTRDRSASGPIRGVASRTRDVIDAVCRIAEFSGRTVDAGALNQDIGVRLEIGLPAEIAELAQQIGAVLSRGEYLGLMSCGLTTGDLLLAHPDRVERQLGKPQAQRILERYERPSRRGSVAE
jgi:helicase